MATPRRRVALNAGLFVAGLIVAGLAVFAPGVPDWVRALLLCLGAPTALFTLVAGLMALVDWQGQRRLLRGEGLVARWRVDPGRWAAFLALEQRQVAAGAAPNALDLPRRVPPEGIEVLLGRQGVMLGETYCGLGGTPLAGVRWLTGPPTCLALLLSIPDEHGPPVERVLRIPTAAGGETGAGRALSRLAEEVSARAARSRPGLAFRRPKVTLAICLGVVVLGTLSFLVGWSLRARRDLGEIVLAMAVAGPILALGAAVLGLVVWLAPERRDHD